MARGAPMARPAICLAAAFVGGYLLALLTASRSLHRASPRHAFVLLVDVIFASVEDRDAALKLWTPVAMHCRDHEPGTLTYEAAISDSDPNRIVFLERYTTKDVAYLQVHKSSSAFLTFREALSRFTPRISGHSYIATDIGYVA